MTNNIWDKALCGVQETIDYLTNSAIPRAGSFNRAAFAMSLSAFIIATEVVSERLERIAVALETRQ